MTRVVYLVKVGWVDSSTRILGSWRCFGHHLETSGEVIPIFSCEIKFVKLIRIQTIGLIHIKLFSHRI